MEKNSTTEFVEEWVDYIARTLNYNKNKDANPESFMVFYSCASTFGGLDPSSVRVFIWTLPDNPRNEKLESDRANIVAESLKTKEFLQKTFNLKLLGVLEKFHAQFVKDIAEYKSSQKQMESENNTTTSTTQTTDNIERIQKQQSQSPTMQFDLDVKFLLFYFEIYKRLISRLLSLHNQTLKNLLGSFEKDYLPANKRGPKRLTVMDEANLFIISVTVEDFYSTISIVVQFLNEKLIEMLKNFPIESLTISQFEKLRAFIDKVRWCFEEDLKISTAISNWLETDNQILITAINEVKSSYTDIISITPLINLKLEFEKAFFEKFHSQNVTSLKKQLEEEDWHPADSLDSYITCLNLFFNPSHEMNDSEAAGGEHDKEILKHQSIDEESKTTTSDSITIIKNEIVIAEKGYKPTLSVLLLVRTVYEYLHLGYRFKGISLDSFLKTVEILKFYNMMATKLILDADVNLFRVIKKITPKIRAFSCNLSFLKMLLEPMKDLFEKKTNVHKDLARTQISNVKTEFKNHIGEIKMKITAILCDRIKQNCASLSSLRWTDEAAEINTPTALSQQILEDIQEMSENIEGLFLPGDRFEIFCEVFKELESDYPKVFNNLNLRSSSNHSRVNKEVFSFVRDLRKLKITSIVSIQGLEETLDALTGNIISEFLDRF